MNAPTSLTPTAPTSMLTTVMTMLATKVLMAIAAAMVTHGWINSSGTEMFVAGCLGALAVAWSWIKIFWDNYGKAIIMAQLEVLKAKSLAQAAALKDAGQPKVTVAEIAAQSPTMDAAAVTKAIATLPPDIKANIIAGAKVMLMAIMLSAMLAPAAFAQARKPLTGNIAKDFSFPAPAPASPFVAAAPAAPADLLGDLMAQIEKIKADTVANVIADINAADADAASLTNPADPASFKDPISHACYPAAVKFLQSLPTSTAPTGTFVGVQLFQKKRDFLAQLQAGLPVYLKLGCAPLLGDEVQSFVKLMAMVGVKVLPVAATALMPALAPITLPALALTP